MTRVKLDVLKPWINQRVANYLNGLEDDVVVEFVFNQVSKLKKKKLFPQWPFHPQCAPLE